MDSRQAESDLLARCCIAARDSNIPARDAREANVFRVAAMLIRMSLPQEADRLRQSSDRYFEAHIGNAVESPDVVRAGWVLGLPRFRDLLLRRLRKSS